jgi:hypothetical protein
MYVEINSAQLILVGNDKEHLGLLGWALQKLHPKKANNRKSIELVIKFKNIAIIIGI